MNLQKYKLSKCRLTHYIRNSLFRISLLFTWVGISIVFELLCPSSSWIYLKSTPLSNNCVAKLCLNEWTETLFVIPIFLHACSKIAWTVLVDMCFSGVIPINNQFPGLYFFWYSLKVSIATSENTALSFSDCIFSPQAPFSARLNA